MLLAGSAQAQHAYSLEGIDPSFIEQTRRLAGDKVSLCINRDSVLAPFDRAVGEAVVGALLLKAEFVEIGTAYEAAPYDYRLALEQTDLFVAMTNSCDALMGYRLSAGALPEWMTVSAPYFYSRSVIATLEPTIDGLDALPAQAPPPGSRMGGPGDSALRSYLKSSGLKQKTRLGYLDNEVLLQKLADGTISAALVWEPALALAGDALLGGREVFTFEAPFDTGTVEFGAAFATQSAFLRTAFDQAIAALDADGTLDTLAERFGLPTSPPQ